MPWCELPAHLPAGTLVKAAQHLMSPCAIVVHAGTKGTILGGVDPTLVFVSFEHGPSVAAAINTLEQLDDEAEEAEEENEKLDQEAPVFRLRRLVDFCFLFWELLYCIQWNYIPT